MKIYHLIIAYNDDTEEIEYIQEHIEDDTPVENRHVDLVMDVDYDYFDDEELLKLIFENGLGEA
jgi:hypothetical protein